jgi:hypothetical protein
MPKLRTSKSRFYTVVTHKFFLICPHALPQPIIELSFYYKGHLKYDSSRICVILLVQNFVFHLCVHVWITLFDRIFGSQITDWY